MPRSTSSKFCGSPSGQRGRMNHIGRAHFELTRRTSMTRSSKPRSQGTKILRGDPVKATTTLLGPLRIVVPGFFLAAVPKAMPPREYRVLGWKWSLHLVRLVVISGSHRTSLAVGVTCSATRATAIMRETAGPADYAGMTHEERSVWSDL